MKKYIKNIAAIMLAASVCACSELEDLGGNSGGYIPAPGETIKLVLNADKGNADSTPETRIYIGKTEGGLSGTKGSVTYYWNDGDQIGVIPLSITNSNPNYVTEEVDINSGDKNRAVFATYISADDYNGKSPDLLIYYPYNESMLQGTTGSTGSAYASSGLVFRLPQVQDQYGYNNLLKGSDPQDVNEHPSVWAVSNYGLAYDLAGCSIDSDIDVGHTDVTATGNFQLDHANTYFQFNIYGTESDNSDKNYGDGSWKVASLTLEAGHCALSEDEDKGTVYTMSNLVPIAGTYKFSYPYNSSDFTDVSGTTGNEKITLAKVANQTSVVVHMNNMENAPGLQGVDQAGKPIRPVPAFAVINAMDFAKKSATELNCLKATVTCYNYDANGNIIGSDTRTRYYNIAGDNGIVGKDIAGNYYTIDFEVCDPVESYTDLSASNTANCYLINAPGNYSFNATVAGNGKLPAETSGSTIMGIDPKNLLKDGADKYDIDWLWASGISFDNISDSKAASTDEEIVQKILNNVTLSGSEGQFSIGLATGYTVEKLSGNIVLALYKKSDNIEEREIVWTWHLWLGAPEADHYRFAATNDNWKFTNEDWYMMDRNLGAETKELGNPRSAGLYYQRGRKEPIIGYAANKPTQSEFSDTWTANQIRTYRNVATFGTKAEWKAGVTYTQGSYNTLKYPMSLFTGIPSQVATENPDGYHYAWSSSSDSANQNDVSNDTKSMFDPCPAGYRMPTVREWDNFKSDIYYYIGGVCGSGAFGYCHYKGIEEEVKNSSDERAMDIAARIANGDYYLVNEDYEREYHVKRSSANGKEIVTVFPNTGVLRGNGQWVHMYNDATSISEINTVNHPAGPSVNFTLNEGTPTIKEEQEVDVYLNAPDFTAGSSKSTSGKYYIPITFTTAGTYYYSTTANSTTNLKSFTVNNSNKTVNVFASSSGSTVNNTQYINAGSISSNGLTKSVYFYSKDANGNISNVSTLTITRNSNNKYTGVPQIGEDKYIGKTTQEVIVTEGKPYEIVINFTGNNFYYAKTWDTGKTAISSGKTIECEDLLFDSSNKSTLFVYQRSGTSSNYIYSAATKVVVNRTMVDGGYKYSLGEKTIGAAYTSETGGVPQSTLNNSASNIVQSSTSAIWTSGRWDQIDSGSKTSNWYTFWYGPGAVPGTGDGWSTKNEAGKWGTNGDGSAPYSDNRKTYGLSFSPVNLFIYRANLKSPEWDNDPAIPTRCIREYDNTSTATVAE